MLDAHIQIGYYKGRSPSATRNAEDNDEAGMMNDELEQEARSKKEGGRSALKQKPESHRKQKRSYYMIDLYRPIKDLENPDERA